MTETAPLVEAPGAHGSPSRTGAAPVERAPDSLGGGGGIIFFPPPPPPKCGNPGQACCPTNWCTAWATCDHPTGASNVTECFACGDVGQYHCAKGAPCKAGLTQSYGFCTNTCGANGQHCCSGTTCNDGLACNDDIVCAPPPPPHAHAAAPVRRLPAACGAWECNGGLSCDNANQCMPSCGTLGDVCCANYGCDDGSMCSNGVFCTQK